MQLVLAGELRELPIRWISAGLIAGKIPSGRKKKQNCGLPRGNLWNKMGISLRLRERVGREWTLIDFQSAISMDTSLISEESSSLV